MELTWLYIIRESKVDGLQRGMLIFRDEEKILRQCKKTLSITKILINLWNRDFRPKYPMQAVDEAKNSITGDTSGYTSGFRSRWTTPWRWQYAATLKICTIIIFASSSEYFPPLDQTNGKLFGSPWSMRKLSWNWKN